MDDLLDRYGVAGLLGVYVRTVDWFTEHEALPVHEPLPVTQVPGAARWAGRGARADYQQTRREVAAMLKRHEDTVTGLLPEGLGAALLEPGGRGKEAIFDARLVYRWLAARSGWLNDLVLRDFAVCAQVGVTAFHHLPATLLLDTPRRRAAARKEKTP